MKLISSLLLLLFSVVLSVPSFASTSEATSRLIARGHYLADHGHYQEAISYFGKAIAVDDKCWHAYFNRALAYENIGEPKQALSDLNRILKTLPREPETIRLRAYVLTSSGCWEKAISDYNIAIAHEAKYSWNYTQRAALLAHLGNAQRARDDWHTAVMLDPKLARGNLGCYNRYATKTSTNCHIETDCRFVEPGESLPEWGMQEVKTEHWGQLDKQVIAEVFCRIKERAPQLVARALNGQKLCFILTRNDNGSAGMTSFAGLHVIRIYFSALTETPEDLEWMLTHELVHQLDVSDYISYSHDFCQAATPQITRCHSGNRQYDWQNVLSWGYKDHMQPRALLYGLPSFYAAKNVNEALAECTAAVVLRHWQAPIPIQRIINERVLAADPKADEQAALLSKADGQILLHPKDAINTLIRALRFDYSCVSTLTDLSTCWGRCGEPEIAAAYSQKALQVLSTYNLPPGCEKLAETHFILGECYYDEDDLERAITEFSRSIAICPSRIEYFHRAECYRSRGDYKRAIADYRKALEFNPNDAETKTRLAELHSSPQSRIHTGAR